MSAAGIDIDIVVVSGCCCLAGRGELGGAFGQGCGGMECVGVS
jgi:hypothetical protein